MFNKVVLVGRVTRKPVEFNSSNIKIAKFTIAVNRPFKSQKSNEKGVDFIPCTAFNKTAEVVINYLDKGTLILVEGSINVSTFMNKENQQTTSIGVNINSINFLEKKSTNSKTMENQNPLVDEMKESFKVNYDEVDNFSFSDEIKKDSKDIMDWEL